MVSRTEVVVTGLGTSSPLGGDVASTWQALLSGASGVQQLTDDWAVDLPARIAARVAVDPGEVLDRVEARTLDRAQQLALVAGREAWLDSGSPTVDPERLAVVIGSGTGGVTTLLAQHDRMRERGGRGVSVHLVPMMMANGPAATLGLELGARAGVHTPVSACASGAEALALGLDLIRAGRADVVVCGGTEAAIHPLPLAGFAQMRALSTRNDEPTAASRPYDKGRDGFVMGEGAAVVVLESAAHAAARGARPYATLLGAGLTADAHHVTAPDPVGAGAGRAMTLAMADAGVTTADVSHVNAHATSTPLGDVAEARAIRLALGAHTDAAAVSATKASTGHLLGAAGALEALLTVLAVHHRLAPPTRNLDSCDDEVDLDVVTVDARALRPGGVGLSNSFGFGGHNVCLAFSSEGSR